jgi:hypothetical protein
MAEITRVDTLARAGYLARATVYGLLGYLALYSRAEADEGPEGAFEAIQDVPAGDAILWAVVIGLIAYGLYKLGTAVLDLENKGAKAKAIMERVGMLAGAIAYLFMAWAAFRFATHAQSNAQGGGSQETAGTVLDMPLGGLLLALAGLGFLLAAAMQLKNAWDQHFMRHIEPGAPPFTATMGRIGLGARSIVFAIMGWSLLRGAWEDDENKVRDLGGVLQALRGYDTLYTIVAVGLIVFAVFSAIEARYRIVPRVDMLDEGRRQASGAARAAWR